MYLIKILSNATEWQLNQKYMLEIVEKFGKPGIYQLASKINRQLDRYVPWHAELDDK